MTQNIPPRPDWQAVPKNDRLKRWRVLDMSGPGRGKAVVADNIRSEATARIMAAARDLLQALQGVTDYTEARADLDEDDYRPEGKVALADARAALSKARETA